MVFVFFRIKSNSFGKPRVNYVVNLTNYLCTVQSKKNSLVLKVILLIIKLGQDGTPKNITVKFDKDPMSGDTLSRTC